MLGKVMLLNSCLCRQGLFCSCKGLCYRSNYFQLTYCNYYFTLLNVEFSAAIESPILLYIFASVACSGYSVGLKWSTSFLRCFQSPYLISPFLRHPQIVHLNTVNILGIQLQHKTFAMFQLCFGKKGREQRWRQRIQKVNEYYYFGRVFKKFKKKTKPNKYPKTYGNSEHSRIQSTQ